MRNNQVFFIANPLQKIIETAMNLPRIWLGAPQKNKTGDDLSGSEKIQHL